VSKSTEALSIAGSIILSLGLGIYLGFKFGHPVIGIFSGFAVAMLSLLKVVFK